jgi:uncharacterized protein (TIGR01777 family)
MKVLVTGASGFVGRAVARELLLAGHELHITSRDPETARRSYPFPCQAHAWDPMKGELAPAVIEAVDAVVHLAGETVAQRWNERSRRAILESRTLGTRDLVSSIRRAGRRPRVLVSASAIGFYGDRGDELLTESSPAGQGFLAEVCRQWEAELFQEPPQGLRTVALRIGVVLGRGGGALEKLLPLFRSGLGGVVGSGHQWMSWVHVDDIAAMVRAAVENEAFSGVLNAVAPEPVTNREFTRQLARAMGVAALAPAPGVALKLAMGEMASLALSSQRVQPERALKLGHRFRHPALAGALEDLSVRDEVLEADQFVPHPPEKIWPFFCEARNLEELTPPFLNFQVLGTSTPSIGEGTEIDYRLKLHGIPLRWRSRIQDWSPGRCFVDTQLAGPYSLWHHTHRFDPVPGGTLMRDRVRYRLPWGFLGRWGAGWKVRSDVETIFRYRREQVAKRFGGSAG